MPNQANSIEYLRNYLPGTISGKRKINLPQFQKLIGQTKQRSQIRNQAAVHLP